MSYILDILACATICIAEVIAVCILAVVIQGTVYRITKFSIYNAIKKSIIKGI